MSSANTPPGTSCSSPRALRRGGFVTVEALTPWLFRLRWTATAALGDATLLRYGILKRDWPACDARETVDDRQWRIDTDLGAIAVSLDDGGFELLDASGRVVQQTAQPPRVEPAGGFHLALKHHEDDRYHGLGDETRECVEKTGHRASMWVRNVASYAPTPWLMSRRGWGLFLSTTWKHSFDLAASTPDQVQIRAKNGGLDVYLVLGGDLPTLLDRGTQLMGRPAVLPRWAYGLTFVCNQQVNAREMLDNALQFRRAGIPCDLIGLEPGWMKKYYDDTPEKEWHPERFQMPRWAMQGPGTFIAAARRMGFKLSLWLCCDYDLTEAEEAAVAAQQASQPQSATPEQPHEDDFEQDEHFAQQERYLDPTTRWGTPWFEHLKQFVDQGARAFKLDGAWQVLEHPDRMWANGMTDAEAHNLYPVLLGKQMSRGYSEHTGGQRSMIYTSGGYAGIGQFAATWAGDTGGGPKPLVSILNHGLSGHANASCDMEVFSAEGIHFGFLQPWSQVNSWAYWRHPWLLGEKLEPIFKFYAQLRYRLLPYLYSMAYQAHHTGMPIARAMPLVCPDHPGVDALMQQYMLGDALLTSGFTQTISLPAGAWMDYWTGEVHQGPAELPVNPPAGRGGPLLVKMGSIIPHDPVIEHHDQTPEGPVELHIFSAPENPPSTFTLYEDDGETLAYQRGAVATTLIEQQPVDGGVRCTIHPRQGSFDNMPAGRAYSIRWRTDRPITEVLIDGVPCELSAQTLANPTDVTVEVGEVPADGPRRVEVRF